MEDLGTRMRDLGTRMRDLSGSMTAGELPCLAARDIRNYNQNTLLLLIHSQPVVYISEISRPLAKPQTDTDTETPNRVSIFLNVSVSMKDLSTSMKDLSGSMDHFSVSVRV